MRCPKCGEDTRVVNSCSDGDATYRERRCKRCSYAFVTIEIQSFEDADVWELRRLTNERQSKEYRERRKREREKEGGR